MPNMRSASPVGRGNGSVVRAGRGRSAEANRRRFRNVGEDSRRWCRTGGMTTTNGGAQSDQRQYGA